MKNLIRITTLTIIAMLVTVGSLMAQDKTESCKSEKKSDSACCSSKETNAKMDHKKKSNLTSIDKNKDGKVFQCPMKCEAPQDENGECSKCGMDLKEVSIKDSKHKMGRKEHKMMGHSKMDHSKMKHASAVENGNSDFTEIDKNNDGKVFQYPMKCELPKDKEGECSKCGMNLKEVSIKK